MGEIIKVFVAIGSAREMEAFSRLIKGAPGFALAGVAKDPIGLVEAIVKADPQAVVLDLDNFGQDPVACVRDIMRLCPLPIILMTSKQDSAATAFEGISAGALTVIKKPSYFDLKEGDGAGAPLLRAIKTYSEIQVIRHVHGGLEERPSAQGNHDKTDSAIVAIASSTGGPQALKKVLSDLPASFPAGLVIAQHISQGFTTGLVDWLASSCLIKVKEPVSGEKIRPAIAYIAPDGYHMTVRQGETIALDDSAPVKGHRPSCDKLLKSVAKVYGDRAVGVILTGMGGDGAEGLKEIRKAGGRTIAQDEKTSVVYGMPKVAMDIGAVTRTTPLDRIAWEIIREFR